MSKEGKAGIFLLGGILGAAAGLLFAPKKGIELRENIFEKSMDILTDSQGVKEDICRWVSNLRNDDEILESSDSIVLSKDFACEKDEEIEIDKEIELKMNEEIELETDNELENDKEI